MKDRINDEATIRIAHHAAEKSDSEGVSANGSLRSHFLHMLRSSCVSAVRAACLTFLSMVVIRLREAMPGAACFLALAMSRSRLSMSLRET